MLEKLIFASILKKLSSFQGMLSSFVVYTKTTQLDQAVRNSIFTHHFLRQRLNHPAIKVSYLLITFTFFRLTFICTS